MSSTSRAIRNSVTATNTLFEAPSEYSIMEGDNALSRASVSSTSNSIHESSGYSTPLTSAAATPASMKEEVRTRLTRRTKSNVVETVTSAVASVVQRVRAMQSSEFSLNPVRGGKRTRDVKEEDSEGIDDDTETADAQLARTLQDEEYFKADSMIVDQPVMSSTLGRPRRSAARRSTYSFEIDSDASDGDFEPPAKKAKLPSRRTAKSGGKAIPDSDDASEFTESDTSEDDVPLHLSSAARVAARGALKGFVADTDDDALSVFSRSPSPPAHLGVEAVTSRSLGGARKATRGRKTRVRQRRGRVTPTTPSNGDDLSGDFNYEDDDDDEVTVDYAGMTGEEIVESRRDSRARKSRKRLEKNHPELVTMWKDLENLPKIPPTKAEQPTNISRELKPFQLEGLNWMKMMEKTQWGGGLLGDEMGMGKTIQAVSLIMSDYPAKNPSLVLIPPVAIMQWREEIAQYTDGTLKTFVYHGTNAATKGITVADLKKYDVILMSYNSLESLHRFQEKGRKRKDETVFQKSPIHQIQFHRVILDEAHNIKQRTTGCAKACFALKADHKWCLSGTPLQNRIGEFFSLIRFLDVRPFASYFCRQCPCSKLEWSMNENNRCTGCSHSGMQHVSVFNQELLNPIQKYGNAGPGKEAFAKLRLLTDRFMLRRVKVDHSAAMELPSKEIYVDRKFFGEEENDFASSIMNSGTRKFETYVAQGVLLNNYANIFGLIMQMRQVADHPDLILKKDGAGGANVLCCCICDEPAEDAIRSNCKHDFCRSCVKNYIQSFEEGTIADCPRCHIPLSIDLEAPEIIQDGSAVKKSSIINRINMSKWVSSSKIEALLYDLHLLRSKNSSSKTIIFSSFTTMLQLVEWRLRRAGITTVMLDGSMTPAQRQASITAFQTDASIECFLVSLKAGGVALNLTEANNVILCDPWWNPAAEWQSADRCHRIGQCRPCRITRLCIEDSVESRMVMLQEKKSNMIRSTINNDSAAMESLTPEDMQFLFRGT